MKRVVIILIFIMSVNRLNAQVFLDIINLSFNIINTANEGGYEGRITSYNNSLATLHGLKAVWHLGDRFNLGTSLHYGNNVIKSLMVGQRYRFITLESAFYMEYVHKRNEKWFWSVPVNFSAGSYYIPQTYVPNNESYIAGYFAVEPRMQINKPLLDWFMVTASGGFRFVSAGNLYGTNNANLAGPSINFSLVFGNFK